LLLFEDYRKKGKEKTTTLGKYYILRAFSLKALEENKAAFSVHASLLIFYFNMKIKAHTKIERTAQ
jgi:hypothetical protein